MKKFNIYALFIVALTLGLASCTKDNLYRPGGADSELNVDGTTTPSGDNIVDPDDPGGSNIVDPDEDDEAKDPTKGKG